MTWTENCTDYRARKRETRRKKSRSSQNFVTQSVLDLLALIRQ